MADLQKKVQEILWQETQRRCPAWDRLVSRPGRDVSEMEFVSRFWGYAFGVAYGIARTENPDESDGAIATLAYDVAHDLFKEDDLHGLDLVRAFEAGKAPKDAVTV